MRTDIKTDDASQQKKRGRPPIQINMDLVTTLSSLQCTDEEIAAALKVSVDTITRRKQAMPEFGEALASGKAMGRISLRRLQWQSAKNGNVAMQIWLGKQMLGQRDKFEDTTAETTQPLPWVD